MIKFAKISAIDSTHVLLKLDHSKPCADCTNNCSDGFLKFLFHKNNILSIALTDNGTQKNQIYDDKGFFANSYQVNDLIGLRLNEKQLFAMALMMYGMPLILMLFVMALGFYMFEIYGLVGDLGGFIGVFVGIIFAKTLNHITSKKLKPEIVFFT